MNKYILGALGILLVVSITINIFLGFQIKNKTAQLKLQTATVESQKGDLASKQSRIDDLQKQLDAKPKTITVLKIVKSTGTMTDEEVTALTIQLSQGFMETINQLQSQIENLNKKLALFNSAPIETPRKRSAEIAVDSKCKSIGADYKIVPDIHIGGRVSFVDSGTYPGVSLRIDF